MEIKTTKNKKVDISTRKTTFSCDICGTDLGYEQYDDEGYGGPDRKPFVDISVEISNVWKEPNLVRSGFYHPKMRASIKGIICPECSKLSTFDIINKMLNTERNQDTDKCGVC